jgi:hypothetical protein
VLIDLALALGESLLPLLGRVGNLLGDLFAWPI